MTDTTADKIFKRLNEVDRNINKRIDDSNKEVNALTVEVAKVNVKLDSKVDELFVVKEIQAHAEKQPKSASTTDWVKIIKVIGVVALPLIGLATGHQIGQ